MLENTIIVRMDPEAILVRLDEPDDGSISLDSGLKSNGSSTSSSDNFEEPSYIDSLAKTRYRPATERFYVLPFVEKCFHYQQYGNFCDYHFLPLAAMFLGLEKRNESGSMLVSFRRVGNLNLETSG